MFCSFVLISLFFHSSSYIMLYYSYVTSSWKWGSKFISKLFCILNDSYSLFSAAKIRLSYGLNFQFGSTQSLVSCHFYERIPKHQYVWGNVGQSKIHTQQRLTWKMELKLITLFKQNINAPPRKHFH